MVSPMVTPGRLTDALRPDQYDRYSRQLLPGVLGLAGQGRLLAARVLVVGAGGLGSPVLQYLAAAGVGHLTVVDDDVVSMSNLHRQVIHRVDDIGTAKVASAVRAVRALNPGVEVTGRCERLVAAGIGSLVAGHDLVVDGSDNFPTRYLVGDTCAAAGVPLVWGSVLGFDGQVSVFWSAPPAGLADGARTLRDLFAAPPDPEEVPSCAEAGVVGALCGQVGSAMAMEAIKVLTGTGSPLMGRVLVVDAREGLTQTVAFAARTRPAGGGAVPGGLAADDAEPSGPAVDDLRAFLTGHPETVLLDVRRPGECAQGIVPGALRVPLAAVLDGSGLAVLPGAGPEDRPVVVYCASGRRSAVAAGALRARGWRGAVSLAGGIDRWRAAGNPVVAP